MSQVMFFGYGGNRNRDKIKHVIKRDPGLGIGSIVEGYKLGTQNLNQIPSPASDLLRKIWGNQFMAYTLRKGSGIVSGILWEINDQELDLIKEWEFIGAWRELEKVKVKTSDGNEIDAITEKVSDIHPISSFVDGLNYTEFKLVDLQKAQEEQQKDFYTKQQIEAIKNYFAQKV